MFKDLFIELFLKCKKVCPRKLFNRLSAVSLLLFICFIVINAQTGKPQSKTTRLPRIGVIKDYEATGMATGCGNFYFVFPQNTESLEEKYVYLSRAEGSGAWMNLDGRDTLLNLLKIETFYEKGLPASWRYFYKTPRSNVKIAVFITKNEKFEPEDFSLSMIITLRRGSAVRQVKTVGYADC